MLCHFKKNHPPLAAFEPVSTAQGCPSSLTLWAGRPRTWGDGLQLIGKHPLASRLGTLPVLYLLQ